MAQMVDLQESVSPQPTDGMMTLTHVLYGMHAFSALMGLLGAAFIVTAFLSGWPSIIAVIINYVKRGDARGTWLESHFSWQIRTFWQAVGWSLLIGAIGLPLVLVLGLGLIVWAVGFFVLGVWAVYRIAKGWMALRDRRSL